MTVTLLLLAVLAANEAEDLTCLKPAKGEAAAATLFYAQLLAEANAALDERQKSYERLKTTDDIAAYQKRLKELFREQLGGLPEATPLNPKVVGRIEADDYVIEKVIYESQPNHHVTANFYLPKGSGPFPAVLISSGHSRTAKTADYNQRLAIALVTNGIAALAYDPIGQGERSQILDDAGKPRFPGTTTEHTLMGVGSILVGTNTARYRVWDAIRSIDYVAGRRVIDAKRIGFTGCSGGGTLTSYTMALDDRVACAAPACYLTTFRKLLETLGPQDAEQNVFGQLSAGIDHPDYVLLRAPKPTLISSTTGDFFSIEGAWDNYRQAKRIYTRLGHSDRVDLVEAEGPHGVQPQNLRAIIRWMRRWLLDQDDVSLPETFAVRKEAELLCTEKGQVLLLPGERSVFDLNATIENDLAEQRRAFWKKTNKAEALETVRKLIGAPSPATIKEPRMEDVGKVNRDGYHIDKFVLYPEHGVPLPGLTYHPPQPADEAYLYLHDSGKTGDGEPGGPIEKLVKEGFVVVAVDLRGVGETGPAKVDTLLGNSRTYFLAYLLGKSFVGTHTEDILAARNFVANYKKKEPRKVHLVAVGRASVPALHAAALAPEAFASVTLKRPLQAWSPVVKQSAPMGMLTSTVHGALRTYDLPDLIEVLGRDKLKIQEAE